MRDLIVTRGLPTLLVLMAIAVILILSGAAAFGFAFGLVVAGVAGVVLVSTLLHDVVQSEHRHPTRRSQLYRAPHAKGH